MLAARKLPVVQDSKGLQLRVPRLKQLLDGEYSQDFDEVIVIDCRFPYEYAAGHIEGAINLWTPQMVIDYLFGRIQTPNDLQLAKRTCVVLHCEFTSERAPRAAASYREFEHTLFQALHKDPPTHYAECFHELYLLRGGYKRFFQAYPELCRSRAYLRMDDAAHRADYARCKRELVDASVRDVWMAPSEHAAFVRDNIMAD
jgi:rhodanese-related sulfurtransferase